MVGTTSEKVNGPGKPDVDLTQAVNKHALDLAKKLSELAQSIKAEPIVQQLSYITAALVVLDSAIPVLDPMNLNVIRKHLIEILTKADRRFN